MKLCCPPISLISGECTKPAHISAGRRARAMCRRTTKRKRGSNSRGDHPRRLSQSVEMQRRRNDFLLVFTLLEMRIVKQKKKSRKGEKGRNKRRMWKREKKNENVYLIFFKRVGPTPTVPSVVKIKFFFFLIFVQTGGNDNIVDNDDDDRQRRRACSLYAR